MRRIRCGLESCLVLLALAAVAALILVTAAQAKTFNWTGAINTDFQNVGNWTTNGVTASNQPCDNDDVIIDAGTVGITTSLDQSTCDFDSFVVGPNFDYELGNSTSDCLIFAADKLVVAGGGENHYLQAASPGWDVAIVRSVGAGGLGNLYLKGTTAAMMEIKRGTVTLGSGLTITTLVVDPLNGTAANVVLSSAATITTGVFRTGTITLTGGTITTGYFDAGVITVSAGAVTNLVQRGGTLAWNTTSTLTDAKIFAGTFNASGDVQPKTITSIQGHYGAIINLDNSIANITVTNGIASYGASVTSPLGELVNY